jgi:hypothetical protein
MKRDMDFIRDLLLRIEAENEPNMTDLLPGDASKEEMEKYQYHLEMLIDQTHFVTGINASTMAGRNW